MDNTPIRSSFYTVYSQPDISDVSSCRKRSFCLLETAEIQAIFHWILQYPFVTCPGQRWIERKGAVRLCLFVFVFQTLLNISVSEHLAPSCHCHVCGVWNGPRKSVWISVITGITTAPPIKGVVRLFCHNFILRNSRLFFFFCNYLGWIVYFVIWRKSTQGFNSRETSRAPRIATHYCFQNEIFTCDSGDG